MQIDLFKDVLVPVVGGLGLFMLGLELMSDGIQKLAAVFALIHKSAPRRRTGAVLDFFRWSLASGSKTASQIEHYWAGAFQAGG